MKDREALRDAQLKVELHLEHINQQTKGLANASTKIWRRISSLSAPIIAPQAGGAINRRLLINAEDIGHIKLRKAAIDALHWDRDESQFIHSGQLQVAPMNEFLARTKVKSVRFVCSQALLIVLGKPNWRYRPDLVKAGADSKLMAPLGAPNGIQEAALLLFREKSGRFVLCHEPLLMSQCVISADCSQFNSEHPLQQQQQQQQQTTGGVASAAAGAAAAAATLGASASSQALGKTQAVVEPAGDHVLPPSQQRKTLSGSLSHDVRLLEEEETTTTTTSPSSSSASSSSTSGFCGSCSTSRSGRNNSICSIVTTTNCKPSNTSAAASDKAAADLASPNCSPTPLGGAGERSYSLAAAIQTSLAAVKAQDQPLVAAAARPPAKASSGYHANQQQQQQQHHFFHNNHHLNHHHHHQHQAFADYEELFELHDRLSKESLLIRADTPMRTRYWLQMLRYHAKDLGEWRRRRTGLANIMMMKCQR